MGTGLWKVSWRTKPSLRNKTYFTTSKKNELKQEAGSSQWLNRVKKTGQIRVASSPHPQGLERILAPLPCYQTPTGPILQFRLPQTFYPVIDYSASKLYSLWTVHAQCYYLLKLTVLCRELPRKTPTYQKAEQNPSSNIPILSVQIHLLCQRQFKLAFRWLDIKLSTVAV